MIRIDAIDAEPITELRYLNARSGGGSEVSRIAILRAHVGRLADELDAIVCCSDLQGVVSGELLGVAVAELLVRLAEEGALPTSARTGIVLAGDLYSVPAANKRGGFGDVSTVWEAFASAFPWVVGVAGNHDDVAKVVGMAEHVHVLDGESVVLDGLRIGGVGGIIGNKEKPGRRAEDDQLARIAAVLDQGCDLVVLHQGPHGNAGQPGHAAIREMIDASDKLLTVCGHSHWAEPLAVHEDRQILNVDARVVVLDNARHACTPRDVRSDPEARSGSLLRSRSAARKRASGGDGGCRRRARRRLGLRADRRRGCVPAPPALRVRRLHLRATVASGSRCKPRSAPTNAPGSSRTW